MLKILKYVMTLLIVAATMLVLAQHWAYNISHSATSGIQQHHDNSNDQPLLLSFEQLLPPFVNDEGAVVRHVEAPTHLNTRTHSDNDDFRVAHTCQITHQQLAKSKAENQLRQSHRERAGFYLYELCKLLI